MKARQAGVPLGQMLAIAQDPKFAPLNDLISAITRLAYMEPNYASAEYQARAVRDFANEREIACYNILAS